MTTISERLSFEGAAADAIAGAAFARAIWGDGDGGGGGGGGGATSATSGAATGRSGAAAGAR
ncbi:MAG: hypothetical protein KKE02_00005, partial [Alphaproteobacteria bacterium]|nr:hypothetical protein [Alphaproteobacteria bacterium]